MKCTVGFDPIQYTAIKHWPLTSSTLGWEDVSLASEGVKEAQAAGKLLKAHGFTFDVVYTRYSTWNNVHPDIELHMKLSNLLLKCWICLPILLSDMLRSHSTRLGRIKQWIINYQFSWLSRAIETAWLVLDELDSLWLPIIKTWRLNERYWLIIFCKNSSMVNDRCGTVPSDRCPPSLSLPPSPLCLALSLSLSFS